MVDPISISEATPRRACTIACAFRANGWQVGWRIKVRRAAGSVVWSSAVGPDIGEKHSEAPVAVPGASMRPSCWAPPQCGLFE